MKRDPNLSGGYYSLIAIISIKLGADSVPYHTNATSEAMEKILNAAGYTVVYNDVNGERIYNVNGERIYNVKHKGANQ